MAQSIESRLAELGIDLPDAPTPRAAMAEMALRYGHTVRVSGQLPSWNGEIRYQGKVGDTISLEDGQQAARLSALNVLAQARKALNGDLNQIERVLNLRGFVAVADGFTQVAEVINGASQLMHEVFGEAGRHTRTAVGVLAMPHNVTVEIEAVFALKNAGTPQA